MAAAQNPSVLMDENEAGELGFEPRLTGSEPVVLPLHHSPIDRMVVRAYLLHPGSAIPPDSLPWPPSRSNPVPTAAAVSASPANGS
jgi:hypothetical protein